MADRILSTVFALISVLAVVLIVAITLVEIWTIDPEPLYLTGKVVGVTDGDTLTLLVDETQYKIRLASIDAPERGQPFGSKAKTALSDMVFGKVVSVRVTDTDKYGRTVGTIIVGTVDVNAALIRQGFAWHYVKYSDSEELAALELAAREAKAGLWADAHPVAPWDWRRQKREKPAEKPTDGVYWLNTSGNVRHNSTCKYYRNTKRGRECGASEGKACGACGG